MQLFRNRNFSLLWLAGFISELGNWMLFTALPFHIYTVTQSALATSGMMVAYLLPEILFGSIGGVYADRWDRRKLMIGVSLLQFLTVPLLLLVQSPSLIWIVYVVAFLESTMGQFFAPAESALLPTLVDEDDLMAANSLNSMNNNLGRIIGPIVGGALLVAGGLGSVAWFDAGTFLLAAVLIFFMKPDQQEAVEPDVDSEVAAGAGTGLRAIFQEWLEGLQAVRGNRRLVHLFMLYGTALFGDAIFVALLVVFVQDDAGLSATQFGWILTAGGAGGVISGLLAAQFANRFSMRRLIAVAWLMIGCGSFFYLILPTFVPMLITSFFVGIAALVGMTGLQTGIQKASDDAHRGRVFGTLGTTLGVLMLAGTLFAGVSAEIVGASWLLAIGSTFYLLTGILAAILLKQP